MQDEVRVTVIATGFDNVRPRDTRRPLRVESFARPSRPRGAGWTTGSDSSLQIRDDEIDIPAFLSDS